MKASVHFALVAALLFVTISGLFSETPQKLPRLNRENLLEYHKADGSVARVASKEDWLKRRAEIVRGMETVMGKLPGKEKKCEFDVKVEEEVEIDNYVRRLITYSSETGSRTPAYLLIPKDVRLILDIAKTLEQQLPLSQLH
ncbi:MAG: hypothetical protein RL595_2688, partial [Planctomycetota bacterium]